MKSVGRHGEVRLLNNRDGLPEVSSVDCTLCSLWSSGPLNPLLTPQVSKVEFCLKNGGGGGVDVGDFTLL